MNKEERTKRFKSMSSIQRQELILKKMKDKGIKVGSGVPNKKSGVALSRKKEAIFFGLANSFNNEIIVSLSFIKKRDVTFLVYIHCLK